MGKSLIIKGADFRANAIDAEPLPTSLDITSLLPNLYAGHVCDVVASGEIKENMNRTCLQSNVDISSYKATYGFGHIRVETIASGISAVPCVIGDPASAQSWTATAWPLGANTSINVNINTGSPSSTTPSNVIRVILYKS